MPLSSDPSARAKQLANLKRGGAPSQWGQTYSLKNGAQATARTLPVEGMAARIYDVLAETAPLRDPVGNLPTADRLAVELLALCLARLESVMHYLAIHGPLDTAGNVRPAAHYEGRLRREAAGHADALGMSPRSRARLGLDLTRTQSFADQAGAMRAAGDRLRARASAIEATAQDIVGGHESASLPDLDAQDVQALSDPQNGAG